MGFPATLAACDQNPANNGPLGSDLPSTLDDAQRSAFAYLAQLRDGVGFTAQLGQRNRLVNGNFAVNQRLKSGSVTLAAGEYGHDRWKAGAAGCTYTFSTSGQDTTINISSGSLQQVIEGANVEGGAYVMSWTGSAQGKIGAGAYGATGVTATGITAGANLTVEVNVGTITKVQLEPGATASQFERRPLGYELALCQRYYLPFAYLGGGSCSTNTIQITVPTPVTMRALPTATNAAGGSGSGAAAVYSGASWFQSSVAANNISPANVAANGINCTYPYGGAVAGWPASIAIVGAFSAEL